MQLRTRRRMGSGVMVATVLALLALAAGAFASSSTLSLKLKGEYAKLHRVACHKDQPNWRAYHRASLIEYRGFLLPAPASHFQVRIKIEKCISGHWKAVRNLYLVGESTADSHPGRFKAFYPARPLSPRARRHHRSVAYYRARAYAGASISRQSYFLVTSN